MEIKEVHCEICNQILDINKDNTYKVEVENVLFRSKAIHDATDCPYCGCQNLLNKRYQKVRINNE